MDESKRLQKVLAEAGVASRRKAEELILNGEVSVNGRVVRELGTKVNPARDVVSLKGRVLKAEARHLYLFHKPRGVITTLSDPAGRPCVGDYLAEVPVRVFPVGRLDFDVSGLLLLTNDGDFAERLLHPRYGELRVYLAALSARPAKGVLDELKRGIEIEGSLGRAESVRILRDVRAASLLLRPLRQEWTVLEVGVSEGRKHFVKKLLTGAGVELCRLGRTRFGPFELGGLRPGELREIDFPALGKGRNRH